MFGKCIYKQLSNFFENLFSKYQCGFRKGLNAQHCLIKLIEKWRECIDQGLEFGILLTDLSKAFDCLPHDLLIAKLNAYGVDISALNFLFDYLTNRKQRQKSVMITVVAEKSSTVFRMDLYWDHFFSIFSFVIHF